MTRVLLSLGSNTGDRLDFLERAMTGLSRLPNVDVGRVSSVYETPAHRPAAAPADWDQPFFNIAALVHTSLPPHDLLAATQAIEQDLGRHDGERWAPRPIDIDIVTYGAQQIDDDRLTLPHPLAHTREFVLAPAAEIAPDLVIPGCGASVLALRRGLLRTQPAWMQIVNATHDSFSGDGTLAGRFPEFDNTVNYIDVGAESTRPGAVRIDPDEEWRRLAPVLETCSGTGFVRPKISVDTCNPVTATRSLDLGVDVINDVAGLSTPAMIDAVAGRDCDVVVMHSLVVPADPNVTLPPDLDPVRAVIDWFETKIETLETAGIPARRLILDPGVGFGKTAAQSLALIEHVAAFAALGCRLLFGHSRKSFLQTLTKAPAADRDVETLAVSAHLADAGVELLRVHESRLHQRFWRVHSRLRLGAGQD